MIAIILAGGNSTRMGQDKAQLLLQGQPLLTRLCRAALSCCTAVYVVTPDVKRYVPLLPPGCHRVQERRSPQQRPPGPLVALSQALPEILAISSAAADSWFLLLACDLPRLNAEVLQDWAQQLVTPASNCLALLPRSAHGSLQGWEPLCGFYRVSCEASLRSFVAGGGRSFQDWLAGEQVEVLQVRDPGVLLNCNTPEEYSKILMEAR